MSRLRPYLAPLLGLLALALGLAFVALSGRAATPPEGAPVFYPAVMVYNYAAAPLAVTIMLVALGLAAVVIPQALGRRPRFLINGLAAGLALAGSLLACWGSLPAQFTPFRHIDRAELNGQVYQLGVRFAADGDSFYVLCACDGGGVRCQCRHLRQAGEPVIVERPELVADPASQTLAIRMGGETVYMVRP